MSRTFRCPRDEKVFPTAREAIVCWLNDMPDLFRYYSLSQIAFAVGATRERIRQIANSFDIEQRRQKPRGPASKRHGSRGLESEKKRKAYQRNLARKK